MSDLGQRIAFAGPTLTPTGRRLAELVLDDPTLVAFGTVADLAKRADTSGPSVVRFATTLDFTGYAEFQNFVRKQLSRQLKRPTDRIRHDNATSPANDLASQMQSIRSSLDTTLTSVDGTSLDQMAALLANADQVLVLCAETSAAPGTLLVDNLRLLRPGVHGLGGTSANLATDLVDVDARHVVVAIDFPRYETLVIRSTEALRNSGATVVAITDGPLSPLAGLADLWASVDVRAVGPFDSVLPTIALIELVLTKVSVLLRTEATDRLDRLEKLWAESGVYEAEPRSIRLEESP